KLLVQRYLEQIDFLGQLLGAQMRRIGISEIVALRIAGSERRLQSCLGFQLQRLVQLAVSLDLREGHQRDDTALVGRLPYRTVYTETARAPDQHSRKPRLRRIWMLLKILQHEQIVL